MTYDNRLLLMAEAVYNLYDLLMAESVKSAYDYRTQMRLFDICRKLLKIRDELRTLGGDSR